MKKLILKLIGLDPEKVKNLQKEIDQLKLTTSNLEQETSDTYNKIEQAIILYKKLGINSNEKWWQSDDIYKNIENVSDVYDTIRLLITKHRKDWVKKNPDSKERVIFHGGCLECITPSKKGVGNCLDCTYAHGSKELRENVKNKNTA